MIPALGNQREEDFEFKVRLSFIVVRLCLRKKNQAGEVGQWEVSPGLRSGKRELIPTNCSLTTTYMIWFMHEGMHTQK